MNPVPFNRHLLVSKQLEQGEENKSLVLVPEEYKQREAFATVSVVTPAQDCNSQWSPGDTVIVPTHTIETLSVGGEQYHLVLENHVLMGLLDNIKGE